MTGDLLAGLMTASVEDLADGAVLLRGFAVTEAPALLAEITAIAEAAPFRHLITPGGFRMSVAMTNCGAVGWISDRRGYRYGADDPETGRPWPDMPPLFRDLAGRAAQAAGFSGFAPEAWVLPTELDTRVANVHQNDHASLAELARCVVRARIDTSPTKIGKRPDAVSICKRPIESVPRAMPVCNSFP